MDCAENPQDAELEALRQEVLQEQKRIMAQYWPSWKATVEAAVKAYAERFDAN